MGKSTFQIEKGSFAELIKKYKPKFKLEGVKKDSRELIFLAENFLEFILATNLSLMMPDSLSFYKMEKNRNDILNEIAKWKMKKSTYYLQKQNLIKTKIKNKFKLTKKGFNNSLFILINKLFIKIPEKWDRKWRIVIFDLPINYPGNRNFLRARLTDLGFMQIQKSVWAFPFPCRKEINFLIDLTQTKPYTYFLIGKISDDKKFIQAFKKIFPKQFRKF